MFMFRALGFVLRGEESRCRKLTCSCRGRTSVEEASRSGTASPHTAILRTNIMDFSGFDSSIILIIRGGTRMSIGDFPESLSQAILVGIMLVGRLGVPRVHKLRFFKSKSLGDSPWT